VRSRVDSVVSSRGCSPRVFCSTSGRRTSARSKPGPVADSRKTRPHVQRTRYKGHVLERYMPGRYGRASSRQHTAQPTRSGRRFEKSSRQSERRNRREGSRHVRGAAPKPGRLEHAVGPALAVEPTRQLAEDQPVGQRESLAAVDGASVDEDLSRRSALEVVGQEPRPGSTTTRFRTALQSKCAVAQRDAVVRRRVEPGGSSLRPPRERGAAFVSPTRTGCGTSLPPSPGPGSMNRLAVGGGAQALGGEDRIDQQRRAASASPEADGE